MNLPSILSEIVNNIIVSLDKNIEEEAIVNVFMAKFCSIMASKQIMTDSIMHIETVPLQYYALNLLPSGMSKNISKTIVDQLFEWHKENCKSANLAYFTKQQERINEIHKDVRSREKAYKEIMEYTPELNGASSQAIYEVAQWILENNFGSLYFFNTEFARMFASKSDYNNILEMSLNGADGIIDYTSVLSNRRKTLDGKISMSMYLATAYEKLLEPETNKDFIELGNTGFFRRSFIYFLDKQTDEGRQYTYSNIMAARSNLRVYKEQLKDIYNTIRPNTVLHFSEEANARIKEYKRNVEDCILQNYSYNKVLLPIDESYKINLLNSPWKIVKVAFLLHLLNDPSSKVVTTTTVEQAIDYFNMFDRFLPNFLSQEQVTHRTYIKALVFKNLGRELSKQAFLEQIRNLVYADLSYKEWNDLINKDNLLRYIVEDLKSQDVGCEDREDVIMFYKINNDDNDDELRGL